MLTKNHKNIAALLHISAFVKLFIPFGNIIGPLIIWVTNKEKTEFIDANGKQALNFHISTLLYSVILVLLCIPVALHFGFSIEQFEMIHGNIDPFDLFQFKGNLIVLTIVGMLFLGLFALSIYAVIMGAIKASEGIVYNYPLKIKFIK